MRNEYKRSDVFLCTNQAHAKFGKKVSVYHVLKVKSCYPEGCVYFYWKCKKLNKGESCPKRYQHVGKNCFGCKEYYDVKITNQLQLTLGKQDWQNFQEELENFEDWLQSVYGKTLSIFGEIDSVKPHLTQCLAPGNGSLQLNGFMLTFKECYIDRTHFEDVAYASVGIMQYKRFQFSPGDKLDFLARVDENHGRILFHQLHRIEFTTHSINGRWDESQIRVALSTATELPQQFEKCHYCRHGVLVDLKQLPDESIFARRLYCLAGVQAPADCAVQTLEFLNGEGCPPR